MADVRKRIDNGVDAELYCLNPIGIVHSPFKQPSDLPAPHTAAPGFLEAVIGEIEIFDEFNEGLEGIENFAELAVIFIFHRSETVRLKTLPPGGTCARGIFATRSPHRPNRLGLSIVKLVERRGKILKVSGLDMVDGTPVVDIKPHTPRNK